MLKGRPEPDLIGRYIVNTSERNLFTGFDVFNDEEVVQVNQQISRKVYKVSDMSARRKIEEYLEDKQLRNLTKNIFDD